MSVYPEDPPRLARAMWKRFAAAMATIVFLTAAGSSTAVLLEVNDSLDAFLKENKGIPGVEKVLDEVDPGGPQTLLVLGSDRRFDDKAAGIKPRSDTIILVRLDPSKDATAVLNIPRDLKVSYRGENGRYSDKINAAYSIGGPKATVKKVKELMESAGGESFPIHHVVNINFGAFSRGVNALDCFYIDVDRRYFNDNKPPFKSAERYAVIDLQPGYQKLCGQKALDFVRFRHLDTDIVRGARQQHFLGMAKDQVGIDRLFSDRKRLLTLFGRYTDTDIRSTDAVLRLLKLAYEASRDPLRRVRFRGDLGASYVTISKENLRRVREEFDNAQASEGAKGPTKPRESGAKKPSGGGSSEGSQAPGLIAAGTEAEDQAVLVATKVRFPAYYPKLIPKGSRFWDGFSRTDPRTYDLRDPDGKRHRAYRMVLEAPGLGEYVGVQGTDWKDPPILANPSDTVSVNGRKLMLFTDGSRLRLVGFKTSRGAYWVTNTLLRSLSNRQMVGMGRSLTRIGG